MNMSVWLFHLGFRVLREALFGTYYESFCGVSCLGWTRMDKRWFSAARPSSCGCYEGRCEAVCPAWLPLKGRDGMGPELQVCAENVR